MAEELNIDFRQIAAISSRLKDLPADLTEIFDGELMDGAANIAFEAAQRAPGNLGRLKGAIGSEKTAPFNYRVYARTDYAPYVEFGTRAQVVIPPGLEAYAAQFMASSAVTAQSAKEAIFKWCKERGIEDGAWYAIYISIMVNGSRPHPFFFPAVDRQLPIIVNRIVSALSGSAFQNLQV